MHERSITTWNAFKHIMIERYKDPREVDKARTRLLTTKQLGSVDGYTTAFDRATLELTEVAGQAPRDEELLFYYKEGLKAPIKTFLAARGTIANLRELQEVAMEIDAAMNSNRVSINTSGSTSYKPQQYKSDYSGSSSMSSGSLSRSSSPKSSQHRNNGNSYNNDNHFRSSSYQNGYNNRYQQGNRFNQYRPSSSFNHFPSSSLSNQQNGNRSYVPMDTSAAIRQQRNQTRMVDNKRDMQQSRDNCYHCGMQGHFARECPSKQQQPKSQQQRSNVIMQESSSAHEDIVLSINETAFRKDKLLVFNGLIDLYSGRILIDSGASSNYISESFVKRHDIYTEPKNSTTTTTLADGTPLSVTYCAPDVQVHIHDYIDDMHVDVIPLVHYDVILGITWLETHGATVDHSSRSITFTHEGSSIMLQPVVTAGTVDAQPDTVEPVPEPVTLITDDQALTAREEPVVAPAPPHDSSMVSICWSILLFVLYMAYGLVQRVIVSRTESGTGETLASTLASEVTYPMDTYSDSSALVRLLYPLSFVSTPFAIIPLLIGFYLHTFPLSSRNPPDPPIMDTRVHSMVHERTHRKAKKARPR